MASTARQLSYERLAPSFRRALLSALQTDTLEYIALHLLALLLLSLLNIDIPPQEDAANAQRNEAHSTNNHHPHHIRISIIDRIPSRRASILQLRLKTSIDTCSKVFLISRQISLETLVEHVRPHSSSDSFADRCADGSEEAEEREADGDFLVVDAGCDHQLAGQGPDTAVDALEELAHDEIADVGTGVPEVD